MTRIATRLSRDGIVARRQPNLGVEHAVGVRANGVVRGEVDRYLRVRDWHSLRRRHLAHQATRRRRLGREGQDHPGPIRKLRFQIILKFRFADQQRRTGDQANRTGEESGEAELARSRITDHYPALGDLGATGLARPERQHLDLRPNWHALGIDHGSADRRAGQHLHLHKRRTAIVQQFHLVEAPSGRNEVRRGQPAQGALRINVRQLPDQGGGFGGKIPTTPSLDRAQGTLGEFVRLHLHRGRGGADKVPANGPGIEDELAPVVGVDPGEAVAQGNRHANVWYRLARHVENASSDLAARGKPEVREVILPRHHRDGSSSNASHPVSGIRRVQSGDHRALTRRNSGKEEFTAFVRPHDRFPAANLGPRRRFTIGITDNPANRAQTVQFQSDKPVAVHIHPNLRSHRLALEIPRQRHHSDAIRRQHAGRAPIAVLVRSCLRQNTSR